MTFHKILFQTFNAPIATSTPKRGKGVKWTESGKGKGKMNSTELRIRRISNSDDDHHESSVERNFFDLLRQHGISENMLSNET